MDDGDFRTLLEHHGYSWKGYRQVRKGVQKRIRRYLREISCSTVDDLLRASGEDPEVRRELERLCAVTISRFFRDRKLWERLEAEMIPELLPRAGARFKVWSAGCASGEEIYGFRILWERLKEKRGAMPGLTCWATDLNPGAVRRGQAGLYPPSSLVELDESLRDTWFVPSTDRRVFRVRNVLKQGVQWRVHNLCSEPPPEREFHMVFLRNSILTYRDSEVRTSVIERVHKSLSRGGLLVVGVHESLPPGWEGMFTRRDRLPVYQKKHPCEKPPDAVSPGS